MFPDKSKKIYQHNNVHTVQRRKKVVHDLIVEDPDWCEWDVIGQLAGGRARVARGVESAATVFARTAGV